MRRALGIETEYGVLAPGRPEANPIELSTAIVRGYAAMVPHAPWDYAGEDPLSDARGFRLDRGQAHPSQLTDEPGAAGFDGLDLRELDHTMLRGGAANAVLTNGARLYVDHAHPEYSSPEVTDPRHIVVWDRAGDEIMREAMAAVARTGEEIVIYKNNVDGKGASYGTHENYLVDREVPFGDIASYLTPFFVTRPLFSGSGRVGIGQRSEEPGFQLSQRADYLENDIGLETTFNRPIINTRDEPHTDPARYRRLHVIVGDANTFDVANYLKFATTSLVLGLLEDGVAPLDLDALTLTAPVVDAWGVSREPFAHVLSTQGSGARRALDVQRTYLDLVARHAGQTGRNAEVAEVLELWAHVLDGLASDPLTVADCVEWVAKKQVLEGLRARTHTGWDDPRLAALDLQWADLRPERSVVGRLEAAGRVRRLVSQDEVAAAVRQPPEGTRAWFRGSVIAAYPGGVAAAGWSSVVLDSPRRGRLLRVPLTDQFAGSKERAGSLVGNENETVDDLLDALRGREQR
nr:proteasome accessory factor PafA2 [Actinomycetales bacterium]